MLIALENVIPLPLKDTDLSRSQVWESEFEISMQGHYLINASSGKGKSTFVNMLYGLRQDYVGKIKFDGQSVQDFSMSSWSDFRRYKISIVFQGLALFPNLSVVDNLLIKNNLTGFKSEREIRIALEQLEIDRLGEQLAGNLSMGQQQRVAIVRSLCQPFSCLLLDEPFSHLDEANVKRAWQLIHNEVSNQNAKSILTTLGNSHAIEMEKELFL